MKPLKFRRPILNGGDLHAFKYWGVDIEGAVFVSPGSNTWSDPDIEDQQMTPFMLGLYQIYEGDILMFRDTQSYEGFEVRMSKGRWVGIKKGVRMLSLHTLLEKYGDNLELVGNVYELDRLPIPFDRQRFPMKRLDWDRWNKNPVILWRHTWEQPPIGIGEIFHGAAVRVTFHVQDTRSFDIRRMLRQGLKFRAYLGGIDEPDKFIVHEISLAK